MIPTPDTNSDFGIHNLPYGVFSHRDSGPRAGMAYGDYILDLRKLATVMKLSFDPSVFDGPYLNDFIDLGKAQTVPFREAVRKAIESDEPLLHNEDLWIPMEQARMHLPVRIGDYTDFYSSIEHATNVGKMFRDPENALLPNWRHLPVGYHGRASSIILSGDPVRRPKGQVLPKDAKNPVFQASNRLDFELEMAFVVQGGNTLGDSIPAGRAEDYIFGLLLFNDWSARDIQKWEYVPLGPFLAKNFASSISPWLVPLEALEPFRVEGPVQEPEVLPYLKTAGPRNFDIELEVSIQPQGSLEKTVCRSNFKYMYWNMAQQLAHHTASGCNIRTGDMLASGTISGPEEGSFGSMLELSWMGTRPLEMPDGSLRSFLEDGDTVRMRAYARKGDIRVGFGQVETLILPAHE